MQLDTLEYKVQTWSLITWLLKTPPMLLTEWCNWSDDVRKIIVLEICRMSDPNATVR